MRQRLPLAIAAILLLGACSTDVAQGTRAAYRSATTVPPLEVPPDLTSPGRDERYIVPEAGKGSKLLSAYQAERAGGAPSGAGGVLAPRPGLRLERAGTQRWLVVEEPAEKLWPLLKTFWQENGLALALDLPEAGVMETEWSENLAKAPEGFFSRIADKLQRWPQRDRYRTRLERGADAKTTEIYISHRGVQEILRHETDVTVWQLLPADPELEAEFLGRLMARLGAADEQAKLALAGAQAKPRARIAASAQGEVLDVDEPFDRAWRRVGLALDRVGFTVEDRDRQNGVYFVRYADPEAEPETKESESLLSRLAFWRSSDAEKGKAGQYRVEVRPEAERSRIRVLNRLGAVEASKTGRRILALLEEQLK